MDTRNFKVKQKTLNSVTTTIFTTKMPSPYEEERVWEGTNQQYEVSLQCAILFLTRIYLLLFA